MSIKILSMTADCSIECCEVAMLDGLYASNCPQADCIHTHRVDTCRHCSNIDLGITAVSLFCRELTRTTIQAWRSQVGKRRGRRVSKQADIQRLGAPFDTVSDRWQAERCLVE